MVIRLLSPAVIVPTTSNAVEGAVVPIPNRAFLNRANSPVSSLNICEYVSLVPTSKYICSEEERYILPAEDCTCASVLPWNLDKPLDLTCNLAVTPDLSSKPAISKALSSAV